MSKGCSTTIAKKIQKRNEKSNDMAWLAIKLFDFILQIHSGIPMRPASFPNSTLVTRGRHAGPTEHPVPYEHQTLSGERLQRLDLAAGSFPW